MCEKFRLRGGFASSVRGQQTAGAVYEVHVHESHEDFRARRGYLDSLEDGDCVNVAWSEQDAEKREIARPEPIAEESDGGPHRRR